MPFQQTISKQNIQDFIEKNGNSPKSKLVQKIQNLKQDMIQRLYDNFGEDKKPIDISSISGIEKEYLELLKQSNPDIDKQYDYNKIKNEIEKMFKKHEFSSNYIQKYVDISQSKYLENSKLKLEQRAKEINKKITKNSHEKNELIAIQTILQLLQTNTIQNTRSRNIIFDQKEFTNQGDKFNIQCFFEEDQNGNRNYFSINEMLNDLETFGIECGCPKIQSLGEYIETFPNIQKAIKVAISKNLLSRYRDYQEIIMFNLFDNEKKNGESNHQNKKGILAEKLVERSFRNFANLEDKYLIKVIKASVGEDQENKIDLIINIKDKKTGINIQKELQLTINNNQEILEQKKLQIQRQKQIRGSNLDLLQLELNLLEQKINLRRNLDRPIGGIDKLLSLEDKEFLRKTYERIILELQKKTQKT